MAKITTKEIYQQIVDDFKTELKNGNPFLPVGEIQNIATKRNYTGFNKFHLGGVVRNMGYSSGSFATYKQITEAGGQVRKGEKSYPVFFWGTLYVYKNDVTVSASSETDALKKAKKKDSSIKESDLKRKTMFIKHFSVFNIDQADDVEFEMIDTSIDDPLSQLINASGAKTAEAMIPTYYADIDTLAYDDKSMQEDADMILKAIVESTGHDTRLCRDFEYAEEELIATIGASFLSATAKIEEINFNSKMVEHWLEILDEKPMFLYKASSQAQKACDFLMDNVTVANAEYLAKAS